VPPLPDWRRYAAVLALLRIGAPCRYTLHVAATASPAIFVEAYIAATPSPMFEAQCRTSPIATRRLMRKLR